VGVLAFGDGAIGKMLVASQVVLGAQLPFAIWPLIRFTSRADIMGPFANGPATRFAAWSLFVLIAAANGWLIAQGFGSSD
jgi:manganese transport protein